MNINYKVYTSSNFEVKDFLPNSPSIIINVFVRRSADYYEVKIYQNPHGGNSQITLRNLLRKNIFGDAREKDTPIFATLTILQAYIHRL